MTIFKIPVSSPVTEKSIMKKTFRAILVITMEVKLMQSKNSEFEKNIA